MTSILHTPAILVNMFKTRVERDKLWLEKNCIRCIPRPLWNIVVDYYAEDPSVIDRIYKLSSPRSTELKIDGVMFYTYVSCRGQISLVVPRYDIFGGYEHGDRIRWDVNGVQMFTTILILPTIRDDGHEIEHYDVSSYSHTFRRFLYGDIKAE